MGYFLDEFKKSKPPTFDGEMKRSEDEEAWLVGTKTFFRFNDYSEKKKDKIDTFSLKGKTYIWWEYVKNFRDIREENLTWDEFERLFRKKYLYERYYDGKAKELYELKMGSTTVEEYTTRFMELLRYVSYLKDDKAKTQRFINGLLLSFKDQIEFDEP